MTYTLFDLTYRTGRELATMVEGTATGGSTSTMIDTVERGEADDFWNLGTIWILEDAAGAGAAPEGEYGIISDFADTGNIATIRDGVTVAIASGDKYALSNARYPFWLLKQCVNRALQELGTVLPFGTAEITTTELTSQYSVPTTPTGVNLYDLKRVFIQRLQYEETDEDEPMTELFNWYVQTTTAGVPATIYFPYNLPADHKLKLMYCIPHPELTATSDQLSETIPIEYVVYSAVSHCLNWYRQKTRANWQSLTDDILYYRQLAQQFRILQPVVPREEKEVIDDADFARFNLQSSARNK